MAGTKILITCIFLALAIKKLNGITVKDVNASPSEVEIDEFDETIDEMDRKKVHKYPVHQHEEHDNDHKIKKPGMLQHIAESLGFGKPKPPKKPHHSEHGMLKPKPKPDITITKTQFMEITRLVTKHPMCIYNSGVKPPCVSHKHKPVKISYKDEFDNTHEEYEDLPLHIEPSAAVKVPIMTTEVAELHDTETSSDRTGRYLKFAQETPSIPEIKSTIDDGEIEVTDDEDVDEDGKYLFKKGHTKTVKHTIWVTKVQKVTDYGVTATLSINNCVPSGLDIPHCPKGGHHSHGSGIWKDEGDKTPENKKA